MKTKVFKIAVFVVFAFITGLNVYKANAEKEMSDIQMKNVEALATGEKPPFENWLGAYLKEVSTTCKICKARNPEDMCNIHDQLPDCYGNN
ncbi:MAG: NVEALA domain-containing protein [Bacteroides sp.]|nr:NVEALA domain-containing protein [Bacteroides sp.]